MKDGISRRAVARLLASAGLVLPMLGGRAVAQQRITAESAAAAAARSHEKLMALPDLQMAGEEKIAMLLYPGFTALDLVGPHYFFACLMGATVDLVTTGADLSPVASDLKLAVAPTATLAQYRRDPTVVFVPGGTAGTMEAMRDKAVLDFLRESEKSARFVTSVCTGSLVLAAAGLLRGKEATSHWVTRPLLAEFGARPVDRRVVADGKIVTGAGVSAGLDLGLAISQALRGKTYAQALMLQAEYAPQPPFPGGTLANTDPGIGQPMSDMFEPFRFQVQELAGAVKKDWPAEWR